MFEPIVFIKWGSGAQEVTPHYEELAAGLEPRRPNRKQVEALLLRLDAQGGLYVLSRQDAVILTYGADGSFAGRTPLDAAGGLAADFVAGAGRYYVVFHDPPDQATVVCLDRAGVVQWRRSGLDGRIDRLLLTPVSLFAAASATPDVLTQLDPATGSLVREHALKHVAIRPFAAPDGALVAATFFPEARRRGVLVYVPETGAETAVIADASLYGALLSGVGVDAAHDLYLHGVSSAGDPPSLFVVGPDAQLRHRLPLGTLLAPRPGRSVVAANLIGPRLQWTLSGGSGRSMQLDLPERLQSYLPDRLTLVDADEDRVMFDLREPVGSAAERVALRLATGVIEPVADAGEDAVIPGMQPAATWQVDADGRVYVPVTSEDGVTIVRIAVRGRTAGT